MTRDVKIKKGKTFQWTGDEIQRNRQNLSTAKPNTPLTAPRGVAGRNSDNTFIKQVLNWEPNTPLDKGLAVTYKWIHEQ